VGSVVTAIWTIRHILWYRESSEAGRQIATLVVRFYAVRPFVWESRMIRDVIEAVEATLSILLIEEQTEQLKAKHTTI
jgi:hypothetical protein